MSDDTVIVSGLALEPLGPGRFALLGRRGRIGTGRAPDGVADAVRTLRSDPLTLRALQLADRAAGAFRLLLNRRWDRTLCLARTRIGGLRLVDDEAAETAVGTVRLWLPRWGTHHASVDLPDPGLADAELRAWFWSEINPRTFGSSWLEPADPRLTPVTVDHDDPRLALVFALLLEDHLADGRHLRASFTPPRWPGDAAARGTVHFDRSFRLVPASRRTPREAAVHDMVKDLVDRLGLVARKIPPGSRGLGADIVDRVHFDWEPGIPSAAEAVRIRRLAREARDLLGR
jgi:hypothetical protein